MKRSPRVPFRSQVLWLFLLAARTTFAGWNFTPPADPNRNWEVTVKGGTTYDDNFDATEKNRQSGFKVGGGITLRASVPLERFLMGMQYEYDVDYPRDIKLGGVDETHNVNAAVEYSFNPRLALSLSENYVDSLQPQLVLGPANAPVTIVQAGTYVYNNVGGNLSFSVTRRWTLSVSGSWDIWRYQVSSIASNNDHQDYSMTVSALYSLDPRTTVGLNYQYGDTTYVFPGPRNGLNATSDTGYLSLVRRFNPQLSASINGGYTIRKSQDGTVSTSPSAYGSLVYNYGPENTLALTVAESLSEATLQGTRQYSAQQNTSFSLQAEHRLTARLRASADLTYTYSTFTAPLLPGLTVKPSEQALTGHLGLNYAFRDWLSAVMDYYYSKLGSSDPILIQPYDRNRISLGMTVTY
ncbi:MAG TPA: outer membrane beta-barrel protein [Verrucomicrobiae bacterium]|nr:outer membrane beta-barrel protein [Verrucomicrobiae bacterium]